MTNKYNTCFKLFSMIFSSRKNKQQLSEQQEIAKKNCLKIEDNSQVNFEDSNEKNFKISTPSFFSNSLKPATTDLK